MLKITLDATSGVLHFFRQIYIWIFYGRALTIKDPDIAIYEWFLNQSMAWEHSKCALPCFNWVYSILRVFATLCRRLFINSDSDSDRDTVTVWRYQWCFHHQNNCIWTWFAILIRILEPNLCHFSILQPSKMLAKCGFSRSWKWKMKPNLGCHGNITINMPKSLVLDLSWYSNKLSFKCESHLVTLWPLNCDLEKSYLVMGNL